MVACSQLCQLPCYGGVLPIAESVGSGSRRLELTSLVTRLSLQNDATANQVLCLQREAYQVEAELIGYDRIPPLIETLSELQARPEIFAGIWHDAKVVAAIAYDQIDTQTICICRLMVHPTHFRKGLASTLLHFVENTHPTMTRWLVATGSNNPPALKLYQSFGYHIIGETEVAPNVFVTQLMKHINHR